MLEYVWRGADQAKPGDSVIVGLAGHGVLMLAPPRDDPKGEPLPRSFFCPMDANLARKNLEKFVSFDELYAGLAVSKATTKLTAFAEALTKALETDAHRPKRERRTARALHAQLKAQGYAGGYTRLTDFIREWRLSEGKTFSTNAFVPLQFGLGEAFQFDWSEEPLVVGGIFQTDGP